MPGIVQKWLAITGVCAGRLRMNAAVLGTIIAVLCMAGMPAPAYAAKARAKAVKATPARAAKPAPSRARAPVYARSSSARGLAHEWEPTNAVRTYKKNYLLAYAVSSNPNNLPTSPNPQNQVLVPYAPDYRNVKFQISFKHDLADFQEYGSVWLGYTQLVFWEFYNRSNSMPIRETIYEPELIYSLHPTESSILNFGAVHQSNGESNPRSRSWNRIYIQPEIEFDAGGGRLVVLARWWQRIQEDPLADDNADIVQYLGYREFELRYIEDGGWEVSAISRIRSVQLDIAAPLASWLTLDDSEAHINIHLHYFNGYGESLLDYNQGHVTWGAGVSFPFDN